MTTLTLRTKLWYHTSSRWIAHCHYINRHNRRVRHMMHEGYRPVVNGKVMPA